MEVDQVMVATVATEAVAAVEAMATRAAAMEAVATTTTMAMEATMVVVRLHLELLVKHVLELQHCESMV